MKNNLLLLIKLNFKAQLSAMFSGKKGQLSLALAIFGGFLIIITSTTLSAIILFSGNEKILIEVLSLLLFITVLFHNLFHSVKIIFGEKDFNILSPMPISHKDLITSKLMALYLFNVIEVFFLGLPALVMFTIFINKSILTLLIGAVALLLVPLAPMVISTVLAMFIMRFTIKFRYRKQIFSLLGTVLLVGLYILFYGFKEYFYKRIVVIYFFIDKYIGYIYPPIKWFTKSLLNNNALYLLPFALFSIVCFVLGVYLLSKKYTFLYEIINSRRQSPMKKISYKSNSVVKALYKKDMQQYFSYSAYVLNTLFGPLVLLFLSLFVLFFDITKLHAEEVMFIFQLIKSSGPFIICAMAGMSITTYCSISIEGKRNWIVYTLPVKNRHIFLSKILVGMTFTTPPIILASIAYYLKFNNSILMLILTIIMSLIYAVYSNLIGLWADISLVNYTWTNPQYVIKQRFSGILAMLGNIIPMIIFSAIVFRFKIINIYFMIFIFLSIIIAAILLLFNHIENKPLYT